MAKYIYSVIQAKYPQKLEIHGLEDKVVYPIMFRDLSAIVSDSSIANFDKLNEEKLMTCVALHQKVNEELLKDYDIIPMAFGMVAEDEKELASILGRAYLQFKRALKRVEHKAEFAVHAFWEEKAMLNDLVNNNPDVKRFREEAKFAGKVRAARIKLGKLVMELVKAQKGYFGKEIEERLKGCSCDIKQEKLRGEDMILNLALLVDKSREEELDKEMQGLGNTYKDKLRFKYIGPMPPYSFARINLSLGNFELIDNARRILGVPEHAEFADVKSLYLGLARKYHPDRHEYTNDPKVLEKMTEKMKEVQEAYEALESYCKMRFDFDYSKNFSFSREDVEDSLLIRQI